MTLRDLIRNRPDMFYPQQWYADEPFLDRDEPPEYACVERPPNGTHSPGFEPSHIIWHTTPAPPAVTLARLYIRQPDHPIWKRKLWADDKDHLDQRVFVSTENKKGLEIHRHLHLTEEWGVPTWSEEE